LILAQIISQKFHHAAKFYQVLAIDFLDFLLSFYLAFLVLYHQVVIQKKIHFRDKVFKYANFKAEKPPIKPLNLWFWALCFFESLEIDICHL
jgi:hypothetical protein